MDNPLPQPPDNAATAPLLLRPRIPLELVAHVAAYLPLDHPSAYLCVHSHIARVVAKRIWHFLHLACRSDLMKIAAVLRRRATSLFDYASFVRVLYLGELWSTNKLNRGGILDDLNVVLAAVVNVRRLYCFSVPYEALDPHIAAYAHLTRLHIGSISVVAELLGFQEVPSPTLPHCLAQLPRLAEVSLAGVARHEWTASWFPYLCSSRSFSGASGSGFVHINLTHMGLSMLDLIHIMGQPTLQTLSLRDVVLDELLPPQPSPLPAAFSATSLTFRVCKLGTSQNIRLLLDLITRCRQLHSLVLEGAPLYPDFFATLDRIGVLRGMRKLGLREVVFPDADGLAEAVNRVATTAEHLTYLELASITPMNDRHIALLEKLDMRALQSLTLLRRSRDPNNISDAAVYALLCRVTAKHVQSERATQLVRLPWSMHSDGEEAPSTYLRTPPLAQLHLDDGDGHLQQPHPGHHPTALANLTSVTVSPQFRRTIANLPHFAPNIEEVGFHLEVLDDTRINGVHVVEIMQEFWERAAPQLRRLVILKASGFGMDRLVREGRKRCEDKRFKQLQILQQQQLFHQRLQEQLRNARPARALQEEEAAAPVNSSVNPTPFHSRLPNAQSASASCSSLCAVDAVTLKPHAPYQSIDRMHVDTTPPPAAPPFPTSAAASTPSTSTTATPALPLPPLPQQPSLYTSPATSTATPSTTAASVWPFATSAVSSASLAASTLTSFPPYQAGANPPSAAPTAPGVGTTTAPATSREDTEGPRMRRAVLVSPDRLERFYWDI